MLSVWCTVGLLLSGMMRLFGSSGIKINDLFDSYDIQNNLQLISTWSNFYSFSTE